jgi:hypothetical protein
MGWKYIMIEATFGKARILFPVIFPDRMCHDEVAAVLKLVGPVDGHRPTIYSAGAIDELMVNKASGESITLGIRAKTGDTGIINTYPDNHGVY